ncbi:hypothetical protein BDN71DRAFT_968906 [Pleurotus eryngii]|uniref:Uncharacterized protein n=1 Tax=Pleurotus eryngii TaxID=5323 RepID=A0A9P6DFI7_PLEER|nr:hypothetical protein BDN71DRAFT_968906 [Pleurotus eryngii]
MACFRHCFRSDKSHCKDAIQTSLIDLPESLVLRLRHSIGTDRREHFKPLTAFANTVNVDFDISPIISLDVLGRLVAISITNMTLSASISGTEHISFTRAFATPLAVPLSGNFNSGTISGVSLTQGALPTVLNALPAHSLDIFSASVNMEWSLV